MDPCRAFHLFIAIKIKTKNKKKNGKLGAIYMICVRVCVARPLFHPTSFAVAVPKNK